MSAIFFLKSICSASNFFVIPNTWELTPNCEYNFQIKMNLWNNKTLSIDSKLFLSWFEFISWSIWDFDDLKILTWIATQWIFSWKKYLYINAKQWWKNNPILWDNINVTNLTLKTKTWINNANINFYFLWSWINWEDSNISSWNHISNKSTYTDFSDSLTNISNWVYTLNNNQFCEPKPIITSWYFYIQTYVDNWFSFTTKYIKKTVWLFLNYPSNYLWDLNFDVNSQTTWYTYRTNTWIKVIITWNQKIKIIESYIWWLPIKLINNSNYSTSKILIITWNINNQILYFENSWNVWNEYNYTGINKSWNFILDFFQIDKIWPEITWYSFFSWWYFCINVSWLNKWEQRTLKDDEFKIIWFSGSIPITTNYLTSDNNIFKISHQINFTTNRSWYLIWMDRAWNTWEYFVNFTWFKEYVIKAHPANRLITFFTPNPNFATLWNIEIFQWNNFITKWDVRTNNNWTWILIIPYELSWTYNFTFKWLSHLKSILTWKNIANEFEEIDFTQWNPWEEIPWEIIKDWEINWVDASVIIQYIYSNWADNYNTDYWFIQTDLNANWQVDSADLTILAYNLYSRDKSL